MNNKENKVVIDERISKDVDYIMLVEDEKKFRLTNDIQNASEQCVRILRLVWTKFGIDFVPQIFLSVSKKRNQSQKSQTTMIKFLLDEIYPNIILDNQRISLLKSVIEVTEGKIFVEFEFSKAIRILTEIYLNLNQLEDAIKLIQDIQIETFSSLERVYKVEYILFQMRILLQNNDFVRFLIVSNKIIKKHLDEPGLEVLKISFYFLMIKYYIHEGNNFEAFKCYQIIYDYIKHLNENKTILENNVELLSFVSNLNVDDIFCKCIIYLNLSKMDKTTISKLEEVKGKYVKELDNSTILNKIMTIKTSEDVVEVTDDLLLSFDNSCFRDNTDFYIHGKTNYKTFRKNLIQHNILIFSKYYSQMEMRRIGDLLKVDSIEIEQEICEMVMENLLYSKINRIKGIVTFKPKKNMEKKMDDINSDLEKMLKTLENTCHLIHKENLKYNISV